MENTIRIDLSQTSWTDVTDGAAEGLITNNSEHSIRYRVSTVQPLASDTFGHVLHPQAETYFNLKSDQRLYALGFQHGVRVALTKDFKTPVLTKSITKFEDGPTIDASGKLRVSQPFGVLDNKNVTSRNRGQWIELLSGVIIEYTGLVGSFSIGEEIRGALPTGFIAIGVVSEDTGTALTITCNHNDFQVGDVITGQTSGATATVVTANTGSDIQHNYNHSSVNLTVGTNATDYAIRQSVLHAAYVPGKGQDPALTFKAAAPKAGVIQRIGAFDDTDGMFIEINEDIDIALVVRTSTSGVSSDAMRIPQNEWNIDRVDGGLSGGPNPSGETLDITKAQFFSSPFLWQGVGPIHFGLILGNRKIYVHEIETANISEVPYIRTPSLPARYEIRNTATTASPTTLEEICSTIASEGGYTLPGLEFSADDGYVSRGVGTAFVPIMAIRLKNEFPAGKPNKRIIRFLSASVEPSDSDAFLRVLHLHDPIDVVATWNDVGEGSAVEYSLDISSATGRPRHNILPIHAPTGQANKASASGASVDFINLHSYAAQNYDSTNSQMFVIEARSKAGTSNISRAMTWIEVD